MPRTPLLQRLSEPRQYDLAIVGGGATGLGVALDAVLRGLSVVLVESHDFAKGTSSRATKLVHGGVRYLAQGNIALVKEALRERTILLHNAPHLAGALPFVVPSYKFWEMPFYGLGLKAYDALAGKAGLGSTEWLDRQQTRHCLPTVREKGLRGGIKYWDGQFDDARLALALARTAAAQGALLVNYCAATGLVHAGAQVAGLHCADQETGHRFTLHAKCVVNATGVWVDEFRRQDAQARAVACTPLVAPSQGIHLVVDRDFLPGGHALMVPKTADGRVLFAVPWLGKTLLGTTDTPRAQVDREPMALKAEVDFVLQEAGRYLTRAPQRHDVKSSWAGLRPLVKLPHASETASKSISREHVVLVSPSGLVTVTGGKWTTYRAIAEDVLEKCAEMRLLPRRATGQTRNFPLIGASGQAVRQLRRVSDDPGLDSYGAEADQIMRLPGAERLLTAGLSEAMVRFAARFEYARTVEDVLARRSRLLFLDAALAKHLAPQVGALLREETGADPQIQAFEKLASQYLTLPI